MRSRVGRLAFLLGAVASPGVFAADAPTTRDLARINWMEFREWVPARVNTVLLPLGTLEPHGVTANGSDILAPVAIANELAPKLNAFMMAIDPALVHKERYSPEMAAANPAPGTWSAYPSPTSIGLYKEGQGYPKFDLVKAKLYYAKVNAKLEALIRATIRKWELAGL